MSQAGSALRVPRAKVTEGVFLALLWAGTAVSLCFVAFRIFVKIKSFRKLFSDDYLVIAAWLMLFIFAVLWQVMVPALYEQYAVEAGQKMPDLDFISKDTHFLRSLVPITMLFYSCLWTVKLSFLLFFRRLGGRVRGQKIWWWCILVVTALTWVACIVTVHFRCLVDSFASITSYCPTLPSVRYDTRTFYANCVADVFTDCLIISIPVIMLWPVRVPWRQKLMLMALFSLTVVVMIVSVIRVAVVNSTKKNADISWLYLWSGIEMATSIIIACLASFRQLFVTANQNPQGRPSGKSSSYRGLLSYFRSRGKSTLRLGSHSKWPSHNESAKRQMPPAKSDSQTQMVVPLEAIHVSHDIDISKSSGGQEFERPQHFAAWQGQTSVV